ncbi:polymerase [Pedobacter sp. MW01-1-1]|uniref:polymerase n=1 Tax=Pedobacter sp. MW01-1-1 TaxID=3383027 RepID=UPI003FEE3DF0
MKRASISLLLLTLTLPGMAQMKLIKRMLSNEKDTTRKPSLMPIPVFGFAQETGLELGVGVLYSVYADRKDTTNRSSNFYGTASYSTKKTYNLSLRGDAWSKGNTYHALGEIRFKNTPFNFYGLGNNTQQANEDKLVLQQVKLAFDLEKAFIKKAYTGVSLGYENYSYEDKEIGGIFSTDQSIKGKEGGNVIYTGVSQSYDTRNSNNYPTTGFFGRITYQYAPDFFGGNNFSGSQIKLDIRNFWKLSRKFVLGAQGLYHTVQSNNTPFYVLPQLGNDALMRGYYTGRYRDENLFAAQAELRYRYNNRFGAVAFIGTGTVWGISDFEFNQFKPNYGAGFRYFFDPAKGLSIRFDYGVGEKLPNEKRQSGFYISFAEAF